MRSVYSSRLWLVTFKYKRLPTDEMTELQKRSLRANPATSRDSQLLMENKDWPHEPIIKLACMTYMGTDKPDAYDFTILAVQHYDPPHTLVVLDEEQE